MNKLLPKLATTAAVASVLASNPMLAQVSPTTPKAPRVQLTQGPEVELSKEYLTIITRPAGERDLSITTRTAGRTYSRPGPRNGQCRTHGALGEVPWFPSATRAISFVRAPSTSSSITNWPLGLFPETTTPGLSTNADVLMEASR
jgi:hypothetical protein